MPRPLQERIIGPVSPGDHSIQKNPTGHALEQHQAQTTRARLLLTQQNCITLAIRFRTAVVGGVNTPGVRRHWFSPEDVTYGSIIGVIRNHSSADMKNALSPPKVASLARRIEIATNISINLAYPVNGKGANEFSAGSTI
ncbi:MAG: hypothetical protein Q9191_005079 [Dirinaria sp. TL-2023a]